MTKTYTLSRINKAGLIKADESRFVLDYRNELNPQQYEAVTAGEGVYLLIAGAGTGKTRTLVYRVARLIETGSQPSSILLLTFTRKAAKEMLDRASLLLDKRCSEINGGTFHSFANLTLRKYASAVGLSSSFTIMDQGDSEDVVNLLRGGLNLKDIKRRFPQKNTLFGIFSLHVNTGRSIEEIVLNDYPQFAEFMELILQTSVNYTEYKRKNSLLDYDDLLVFLRLFLLDLSPAAKSFLSKIKFTMVDEYQDTNRIQSDIVLGLSGINRNIMAVGDDSQSIYSFRGADFQNIIRFPEIFPGTKILKLEENYRSTPQILNFTNFIIENATEKYPKKLFTSLPDGEMPAIISAVNDNMQSKFIADKILALHESGIALSDIAVLFRSSFFSFDLEIELNKAGIPFVKFGGMKFIESAHIKDLLGFLRILANSRDIVSWYRVLLLHEGVGRAKAGKIVNVIPESAGIEVFNPESPARRNSPSGINALFDLLFSLAKSNTSVTEKAEKIIKYYDPLFKSKYDDFKKRKKDLDMFLNISSNYKSLESFLTDMALEPPRDSVIDVSDESSPSDCLVLSTIHSAKGLEWNSVFIMNALDGLFPSEYSFEDNESIEEERRLMYVASTRAKRNLFIVHPMNIYNNYTGVTYSKPSRFIEGADESIADQWILEDE